MPHLIAFALAVALAFALKKLWDHHRATQSLLQALLRKQTFLREDIPGASGRHWDDLCTSTNELIQEVTRLQQLRSGQLAQLEATLGSLQEAVLIVDVNNSILLANQALQAIFPRATNILGQRL